MQEAGYSDVTTTALESHSLRGQMLLAYCSDVIVGIHGAGMGWVSYPGEEGCVSNPQGRGLG